MTFPVALPDIQKYDYYKEGAVSGIDAIADIRNGNGFTSNIDGISFKKIRKVNNGYLYEISIPYEKKLIDEEKPFRRVDGNHRLQAMEDYHKLETELKAKLIDYYKL